MSAGSLALGIIDVTLTYMNYYKPCTAATAALPAGATLPAPCNPNILIFTWVAIGIWASIPVIMTSFLYRRLDLESVRPV